MPKIRASLMLPLMTIPKRNAVNNEYLNMRTLLPIPSPKQVPLRLNKQGRHIPLRTVCPFPKTAQEA